MSSNSWIFAPQGRAAALRRSDRGDCRPNRHRSCQATNSSTMAQLQQRSMSVVVRPTYYDCEEDHLCDGIGADRTMLKGLRQTSLSSSSSVSMSPSLIMAALKKRSPSLANAAAAASPDDDSNNNCNGRQVSFDSTSSLRSSAAANTSSSSSSSSTYAMRRSASEPDLRRAGGGDTSRSAKDDDNEDNDAKKGQEAQTNITGTSDRTAGPTSDEVVTVHDLRADYVPIHASIDHTTSPPTNKMIVVVPSIDLDGDELKRVSTFIENYEERQLYHLLMLNDPGVRVVYTSSHPVSEAVVRYYVGLRGNGDGIATPTITDQMSRLYMISPNDDSKRPLSKKLLARPLVLRLIERLMEPMETGSSSLSAVHSNLHRMSGTDNSAAFLSTAGLSVYTGSNACDDLAHSLGLRLLESCGETMHFGTKQGSREIFAAAGIPHPAGTPDLTVGDADLLTLGPDNRPGKKHWASHHPYIRTPRALAIGLARQIVIKNNRPKKWMVKLNQGFSGMGNASLDLQDVQTKLYEHIQEGDARVSAMADDIESTLPSRLKFECPCMTWEGCDQHIGFRSQIAKLGVIAEAFLDCEVPTSPSFQAVIEPDSHIDGGHSVKMLSTHEQLLDGQIYEGCINPCSSRYRARVVQYGKKVGEQLEANGIVGHFSCDFLATKNSEGDWDLNAVEINLRQGGTTHPHAHMALLCGGQLEEDGVFHMINGDPRFYVATDCYRDEGLKGMDDADLISFIQNERDPMARKIRWDPTRRTGVVFHLFKFIKPYGRVGFTAIGASSDHAHILYDDTVKLLKQISKKRTKC